MLSKSTLNRRERSGLVLVVTAALNFTKPCFRTFLESFHTEYDVVEVLFAIRTGAFDNFPSCPSDLSRRWFGIAFFVEHDRRNFLVHLLALFLTFYILSPSHSIPPCLNDDSSVLTASTTHGLSSFLSSLRLRFGNDADLNIAWGKLQQGGQRLNERGRSLNGYDRGIRLGLRACRWVCGYREDGPGDGGRQRTVKVGDVQDAHAE